MAIEFDNGTTSSDNFEKAIGFINFTLPSKQGKNVGMGSLKLMPSNPNHVKLNAWLEEDPSRVEKVVSQLQANYNSATKAELDFDFIDAA